MVLESCFEHFSCVLASRRAETEAQVRLYIHSNAVNAGSCSVPKTLCANLWEHALGTISREHFIFSIFMAPPEELIRVRICCCCNYFKLLFTCDSELIAAVLESTTNFLVLERVADCTDVHGGSVRQTRSLG